MHVIPASLDTSSQTRADDRIVWHWWIAALAFSAACWGVLIVTAVHWLAV